MSEEFPATVKRAVKTAARKHKDDVKAAIAEAVVRVRKCPQFKQVVDLLVERAVASLVYALRQSDNTQLKRNSGEYATHPKVRLLESASIREACTEYHDYAIAGRSLGVIRGSEFSSIMENENGKAAGHMFNVELLKKLRPMVGDDQQVKDAVSSAKLKKLFNQLDYKNRVKLAAA